MIRKILVIGVSVLFLASVLPTKADDIAYNIGWSQNLKLYWKYENFKPTNVVSSLIIGDINKDDVLDFIIGDSEGFVKKEVDIFPRLDKVLKLERTNVSVVDGHTGKTIWNLTFDSGIGTMLMDVTGDGGDELIWYEMNMQNLTLDMAVFKSENGGTLWNCSYPLISDGKGSVSIMNVCDDYTGDEKPDILVENSMLDYNTSVLKLRVQCIDGSKGKSFWFRDFAVNITGGWFPTIVLGGDLNNDKINDTLIFAYDYVPPFSVRLNRPNGCETLKVGSSYLINWTTTGGNPPIKINLSYRTSSTGPWTMIANNQPDTGNFNWPIPNTPSTDCWVKVTATDVTSQIVYDISDNNFTISSFDMLTESRTSNQRNENTKYFGKGSFICALNGKTGKEIWNISVPPHCGPSPSASTYRPGVIFDDFTGDNKIDIAYTLLDVTFDKCNITVRDGLTGKLLLVREVNVSFLVTVRKPYYYKPMEFTEDYTGDGIPDLMYYNQNDGVNLLDPITNKTVWTSIWLKGQLVLGPMRCDVDNDKINDVLVWEYIAEPTQNLMLVSGKTGNDIWKIESVADSNFSYCWVFFMNFFSPKFSYMNSDKIPDIVVTMKHTISNDNITVPYVCYDGKDSKALWKNQYTFDVGSKINKNNIAIFGVQAGDLTGEGGNDINMIVNGISNDGKYFRGWTHILGGEVSGAYLGTIYTDLTSDTTVFGEIAPSSVALIADGMGITKGYDLNKDGIDNDFLFQTKKGVYIFITPPIPEYSTLLIPLIAVAASFVFVSEIRRRKRK